MMKLRNVLSVALALHVLSMAAMSPEEKAEFKAKLKAAQTSDEMEQVVKAKRPGSRLFSLEFSNNLLKPLKIQKKYNNDPIELDVIRVVRECFLEEMQPLADDGPVADDVKNAVLARYQKYTWLNPAVVNELTNIFNANDTRLEALKYNCRHLRGIEAARQTEQNFQRDMQALRISQLKNRIFIGVVIGGIIMLLAILGTKEKQQNEQEYDKDSGEAEQEDET